MVWCDPHQASGRFLKKAAQKLLLMPGGGAEGSGGA
jgi:hypothetical protein